MDEEPEAINVYGTCLTVGCENSHAPVLIQKLFGELWCGPCGNPVTNITDIKPTEGTVLPEWILQMLQTQNSDN